LQRNADDSIAGQVADRMSHGAASLGMLQNEDYSIHLIFSQLSVVRLSVARKLFLQVSGKVFDLTGFICAILS